jgi:hypothetical protein
MLGSSIGDVQGQTIGTRVLPDTGHGPCMEITDRGTGTLYGVQVTSTVTYLGTMRPNGTIVGDGNGIVMTEDGEAATFRGAGVGTFTRPGAMRWRGSLFYETQSGKLAALNGIAVAFEYDVDESGKSEGHFYEWK